MATNFPAYNGIRNGTVIWQKTAHREQERWVYMNKRMYAIGMLTMVGVLAAACGKVESGSDTASTHDTASQSSTAVSSDTSSLDSTAESSDTSETIATSEHLADPYFAIFAGKHYVMTYHYAAFTGERVEDWTITAAIDGDNKAVIMTGPDMDINYLTIDGQAYEIDNLNKTVTIKESQDSSADAGSDTNGIIAVPPFKDAGITYAGSGEQDGLVYEEYYATNGDRMFYYFEGTVLKRIRSASGENTITMDVSGSKRDRCHRTILSYRTTMKCFLRKEQSKTAQSPSRLENALFFAANKITDGNSLKLAHRSG